MFHILSKLQRDDEGAAMAEFVVTLPVIILIFFGIMYFGEANVHRSRVYVGTRFAAWEAVNFENANQAQIESRMNQYNFRGTRRGRIVSYSSGRNGGEYVAELTQGVAQGAAIPGAGFGGNVSQPSGLARELLQMNQLMGMRFGRTHATVRSRFDSSFGNPWGAQPLTMSDHHEVGVNNTDPPNPRVVYETLFRYLDPYSW